MEIITCKNDDEVAKFSFAWLIDNVEQFGVNNIYLPAGSTPIKLYQQMEKSNLTILKKLRFFQIDEVLDDKFIFKNFFIKHLPHFINQFEWITNRFSQAELAILGLGLNGHIGFHEPHVEMNFTFGKVELSKLTCDTLNLEMGINGLTYGVSIFNKCKANLLIVTGNHKKEILNSIINKDYQCPAQYLIQNSNTTIITDIKL